MSTHVPLLRRRREGVTDYRARKRAITSQSVLLVVRISDKNAAVQFVKAKFTGDEVLSSASSRELAKLGWKGSLNSTPSCYLLGLLAGRKAAARGVKGAVLYNGVARFIVGSRVAACVKGVIESGLAVPADPESFPDESRVSGKPIADFAADLAKRDRTAYERRFSSMLKRGFKPEDYPANFEKMKQAIVGGAKK
jgi:large subunit ribosomal protein L18